MLQVDKVGAMSLEEATPQEALLQLLQRQISCGLLAGSAQINLAITAGGVENLARIKENNPIFLARWDRGVLASIVTVYVTSLKDPHPLNLQIAMINPPKSTAPVQDVLQYPGMCHHPLRPCGLAPSQASQRRRPDLSKESS